MDNTNSSPKATMKTGLKKIPPYWHPYRTMAKGRWFDREILELVSSEFRDRSVEYYRYALESGVTTVNGKVAMPGTIVRNGDTIENIVHRHEPPVTSTPVQILYRDPDKEFIVINKPGSIVPCPRSRTILQELISGDTKGRLWIQKCLHRQSSGSAHFRLDDHRAQSKLCSTADRRVYRGLGKEGIYRSRDREIPK